MTSPMASVQDAIISGGAMSGHGAYFGGKLYDAGMEKSIGNVSKSVSG